MYLYINTKSVKASQQHASLSHNFSNDPNNFKLIGFVATNLEEIVNWSKNPSVNAGINVGMRIGRVEEVLRRCNPHQIDAVEVLVNKINEVVNSMFADIENKP